MVRGIVRRRDKTLQIINVSQKNRYIFEDFLPEYHDKQIEIGVIDKYVAVGAAVLEFRPYAIWIQSLAFGDTYQYEGVKTVLDYVADLASKKKYPMVMLYTATEDDFELERYRNYGFTFTRIGARYSFSLKNFKKSKLSEQLLKNQGNSYKSIAISLADIDEMDLKRQPMLKDLIKEERICPELSYVVLKQNKIKSMCIIGKSLDSSGEEDEALEVMYLFADKDSQISLFCVLADSLRAINKNYKDSTEIVCATQEERAENLIKGIAIPEIVETQTCYYGNVYLTDLKRLLVVKRGKRYGI